MRAVTFSRITLISILVCLMTGCDTTRHAESDWRSPDEVLVLGSICELYKESGRLHAIKHVNVSTTLYRIGPVQSFGDEYCPQRHPLVDIEVSPQFLNRPCEAESEPALCSAISLINKSSLSFEITAEFTGRVYAIPSDDNYSVDGMRFVFVIDGMKNLTKVRVVEAEKP